MRKLFFLLMIISGLGIKAYAQDWVTDLDSAKQMAAKDNKTIVLVFQGSDWCAPCIRLDRDIWQSEEFISYASKHYVMLVADFPRKKQNQLSKEQQKKNATLAELYNKDGIFPKVVLLNQEANVLGVTGYKKMTPEEYITHLQSFL